jgi:hypothetical protein
VLPRSQSLTRLSSALTVSVSPDWEEHVWPRLRDPANYRCSLGTNTVLGLVTNGLLAVLADGGAEN